MIETLAISLSGPAFSFLLYENLKNSNSQEGFLLGELVEKESRTITDNDQRQVHVSRVVKINSSVPCPNICYFYDGIGRLDPKKIKNFLGALASKVVAWYKYQATSSFNFNFREKLVHKQLSYMFDVPSEFFTCCLLISESSDNRSTHSFTQNFIRYNNNICEQLPLHIVNLSDANNTYKSSERMSETFLNILKELKINHKKSQGLAIITVIQNALQKHTNNNVANLASVERKMFQLENEVKRIKQVISKDDTNASNKESQFDNIIAMDTDPVDYSNLYNSDDGFIVKRSLRNRGNTTGKTEKKPAQSSLKKSNTQEITNTIQTRSKKR